MPINDLLECKSDKIIAGLEEDTSEWAQNIKKNSQKIRDEMYFALRDAKREIDRNQRKSYFAMKDTVLSSYSN